MIYSIHFLSPILILFISVIVIMGLRYEELDNYHFDDLFDIDPSITNESLLITPSDNIENSTNINSPSSMILKVLLTSSAPPDETIDNEFTSFLSLPTSVTSQKIEPPNSLIDQINFYRNAQILSHIKECDPNMRLNDICETYSINSTSSLMQRSSVDFYTLQDLSDAIVDRIIVQKLNESCLSTNGCLGNLSENDIQYIKSAVREHGLSFCSLEQCHSRLLVFINSCSTLSNTNISIPTLKLLPMLCTLYNEQQSWSSTQCMKEIVNLLHIFYAFWPQFETCYDDISTGFNGCTPECQTFDSILHNVENQCNGNAYFLSRVPALAWYRSINLKEICHPRSLLTIPPFIYSVEKFFSSNKFWYRFDEKSIYTILFLIIIISVVISFSLCIYLKLKYRFKLNNRRFDENYEYTRLHNSSFELGTNTEIPNTSSTIDGILDDDDDSQIDSNGRFHPSEYRRLLFVDS